jgi:hypothetical protein
VRGERALNQNYTIIRTPLTITFIWTTEMTGRNRALNAARPNGRRRQRQRQLLEKKKLAAGNPFLHLTSHANG